jgi:hypothetical protein
MRPHRCCSASAPAQHTFSSCCCRGRARCGRFHRSLVNARCRPTLAQADALAYGSARGTADSPPPAGSRPSSILTFRNFTLRDLGRLLAHEHKVFTGRAWNINSFDQWVELGNGWRKTNLQEHQAWTRNLQSQHPQVPKWSAASARARSSRQLTAPAAEEARGRQMLARVTL